MKRIILLFTVGMFFSLGAVNAQDIGSKTIKKNKYKERRKENPNLFGKQNRYINIGASVNSFNYFWRPRTSK